MERLNHPRVVRLFETVSAWGSLEKSSKKSPLLYKVYVTVIASVRGPGHHRELVVSLLRINHPLSPGREL